MIPLHVALTVLFCGVCHLLAFVATPSAQAQERPAVKAVESLLSKAAELEAQGRFHDAVTVARNCLDLAKANISANSDQHIRALERLGVALTGAGQYREAAAFLREALDLRTHALSPNVGDIISI